MKAHRNRSQPLPSQRCRPPLAQPWFNTSKKMDVATMSQLARLRIDQQELLQLEMLVDPVRSERLAVGRKGIGIGRVEIEQHLDIGLISLKAAASCFAPNSAAPSILSPCDFSIQRRSVRTAIDCTSSGRKTRSVSPNMKYWRDLPADQWIVTPWARSDFVTDQRLTGLSQSDDSRVVSISSAAAVPASRPRLNKLNSNLLSSSCFSL